ncbi:MAG TPA: glycoside hydrolase family 92 protein, partial [Candidatus Eremiobacteraceae bacterium]|nr:glycoside hydrolase family 92 protein [Candidatus Eremiobacteraceae bacterium]
IFYTALYHALLHPNVVSDADGSYIGYDGAIHRAPPGHDEYSNISDWDIYRSQIPLIALIAPHETSDIAQSLVDAAAQEGALPRWAVVNSPTAVMGGDSPDPVIAGAYSFGARAFDAKGALAAMIHGSATGHDAPTLGWYAEREHGAQYDRYGYVDSARVHSASETLEYSFDDFAISRLARSLGDAAGSATFLRRSSNWANLMDVASDSIQMRDASGAFVESSSWAIEQPGFQEGNSAQYTWMVPQDLADVIDGVGGRDAAIGKLDALFADLNGGWSGAKPLAWLGNEPSLDTPFAYLFAGAPWRTQAIIRQAITQLYGDSPNGLPGNDDLGEMSAWYVWCALGVYPQDPPVRILAVGSPMFPHSVIRAPGGPTVEIDAPAAATNVPYVQALRVNGEASDKPWFALPQRGSMQLQFDLAAAPDKSWGSAPDDAPPSFVFSPVKFPPSTTATLTISDRYVAVGVDSAKTLTFDVSNRDGRAPVIVDWRAAAADGVTLTPASGTTSIAAGAISHVAVTVGVSAGVCPDIIGHRSRLRPDPIGYHSPSSTFISWWVSLARLRTSATKAAPSRPSIPKRLSAESRYPPATARAIAHSVKMAHDCISRSVSASR